jgi:LmbE family N-acetylglucosaminyl deacetylase
MAVFAHPDDEAFGTGGTLTKYAAEGHEVHVVTATRGEAGLIHKPGLTTAANLPFVREQELRCACDIYGIPPPHFLDYQDGQLAIVNQGQAVGRLVRVIQDLKPDVIITFGPDGIYGHYDHIAVWRWTSLAVELAADPDCFPVGMAGICEPHQVRKLYWRALPQRQLDALAGEGERAAVMMDGVPFYFTARRDDEITTIIDVSEHVSAKLRGIQCHASQIGAQNRFYEEPDVVLNEEWFRQEHYVLAHSTVGRPAGVETDLFAGLR